MPKIEFYAKPSSLKRSTRITVKVVAKAKDGAGNVVKKSLRVVLSRSK